MDQKNQTYRMENKIINTNKEIEFIIQKACNKIAPVWPLENFVAVNPYQGLAELSFENAASVLSNAAGIKMTMPISFYRKEIDLGNILYEDIEKALLRIDEKSITAHEFLSHLKEDNPLAKNEQRVVLVADVISNLTRKDWSDFVIDRITFWASAYFDNKQAVWRTSDSGSDLFSAWRSEALTDFTPIVMGLKNFHKIVEKLPEDSLKASIECLKLLQIEEEEMEIYLHSLLLRSVGWASYVAGLEWNNKLYGGEKSNMTSFLAILLSWEVCLMLSSDHKDLHSSWEAAKMHMKKLQHSTQITYSLKQHLILQRAYDNACQRELIQRFETKSETEKLKRNIITVQAIFCIDVRSEVLRRNLELVSAQVETLGFAGFFAFPVKYVPIAHASAQNQCPVLIPAGPIVMESLSDFSAYEKEVKGRIIKHQIDKSWQTFKLGAISCFSFVGPVGLAYVPKLFSDAFGFTRPVPHPDKEGLNKRNINKRSISLAVTKFGNDIAGIPLDDQIKMAISALRAMSLTENFARLVLIVGHGSSTVNNPHATGLDCGACGGHTGEANAKVAATVLNNPLVREGMNKQGISIPTHTCFVACQHDTTTDEVVLFNEDILPTSHYDDNIKLKEILAKASHVSRIERATRMHFNKNENIDVSIFARSRDWSQVRPEWGLAGCNAFIVAQRERTEGINLEGKSFLHSYEWQKDAGFSILELIMTAPMVVTSWINLQYYASTVDNKSWGAGNKTLHNITGGIGVLEGYAGDLRIGLPWQSIHDGENYQHLPQRLNVIIDAPIDAINSILAKHPNVQNLCDNDWINLLAMNSDGKLFYRYNSKLEWECLAEVDQNVYEQ